MFVFDERLTNNTSFSFEHFKNVSGYERYIKHEIFLTNFFHVDADEWGGSVRVH
jgi:hypothetical protein